MLTILSVIVKTYFALYWPILGQCSVTEPPQNMQKKFIFLIISGETQVEYWSNMGYKHIV